MLLSSLEDLRDAADAAFEGLCSALMGIDRAPTESGGPYRAVAPMDDNGEEGPTDEVRLFTSLDAAGVPAMLRRGLVHTEMLGILGAARRASAKKVALLDRLRFWSEAPSEATEAELAARERWHLDALRTYGQRVHAIVSSAAAVFPLLSIRNGLMVLSVRLDQVRAESSFLVSCSLVGKDEALDAANALIRAVTQYPFLYPPLQARMLDALRTVASLVFAISSSYEVLAKKCVLRGKDEARFALRRWTESAIACLGRVPSDGELLERYAMSRLR